MKRTVLTAAVACLFVSVLGAQTLDKPAATIRLTRTESISVSKLQKLVTLAETQAKRTLTLDERKQALDGMVGNALILQAADRDKFAISDAELKAVIGQYAAAYGQLAGLSRAMTDAELQAYVKSSGSSYDDFTKQLKDQQTVISYVKLKRKAFFDAVKAVTDADIQDYYDSHKSLYFADDMITLRHIFLDTRQLTNKDDIARAAKRADDILKELKAGQTFADLVMKYSEDTKSKYNGGLYNSFSRSDTANQQFLGAAFFDAIFKLKKGDTSGVLQSNIGFHIVQVADRFDAKLLTLDDKLPPQYQTTLRENLRSQMLNQRQTDALNAADKDLVAELKKTADVKIFSENLSW